MGSAVLFTTHINRSPLTQQYVLPMANSETITSNTKTLLAEAKELRLRGGEIVRRL